MENLPIGAGNEGKFKYFNLILLKYYKYFNFMQNVRGFVWLLVLYILRFI